MIVFKKGEKTIADGVKSEGVCGRAFERAWSHLD
jgi:hypothetical protein